MINNKQYFRQICFVSILLLIKMVINLIVFFILQTQRNWINLSKKLPFVFSYIRKCSLVFKNNINYIPNYLNFFDYRIEKFKTQINFYPMAQIPFTRQRMSTYFIQQLHVHDILIAIKFRIHHTHIYYKLVELYHYNRLATRY